ncbi:NAD-binding protein [Streptomyces sp. ISL-44]|uniref:3-hydroxyacyl-CoA dehydrogenase family protein n=1 Tax=unclassified Streptomyces TaxID=2593676 RepID=UPI001BE5EB1D|nr:MULTISPECIES: 3-hydroxyacyl-CoA dehydrogenase NAD-binding domain-containing protein [unclassified Streptomyces]MBT2542103.1 NAD-binding protein [Streptomyces sp. ISL-44]MCX5016574.1 3-hydroxyacyl-CoA dehydrogenase NAD-binding domain-containing protein [Streptomyces sp. NBC_00555]MCX5612922.1 3-hydroxyacyl-CoA dehydrogenase NAD-binding domain-containing protein [Streptomyces sp. NBC_00047]UUU45055.1 3-hydroxyacyl-CoA dehydrogenase NAD-binding domain-containing protein [Streptomyces sp. NBC_00
MEFTTAGVVGAGVMGVGVAQNLAQTGHRVVLVDVSEEILENARKELRSSLRAFAMFNRKAAVDPAEVFEKIEFTTDYELLAKADFVVENVTEEWAIKEKVYKELDRICRPEVVFAVNTSAISITRVGSVTSRPERVVGMHFMNPVPLKPMVEVIRGHHTTPETIDTARRFLAELGKECIVVEDVPGFVSNRVLMLTINEAVFLVQDGVAPPADVDRIFKTCFDHKMGPLETADLIGLDTILKSVEVLYESFNDSKYRPAPLLKKMVAAGLLGRKSGQGFHTYR